MDSPGAKEVKVDFPGRIRVYTDNSVERFFGSPYVPPSLEDPETGVASKDVTISTTTGLSARLYLPKLATPETQTLPVLVYFHGGAFCLESAFSLLAHRYMNILASLAQVMIVSVEYRLAPEHPLPTAYNDCWDALQWVASHRKQPNRPDHVHDPWLAAHVDFDGVFIGGDSAGANIAHNLAMRANTERLVHGVTLLGAFVSHPYFLDGNCNKEDEFVKLAYKCWNFVYPDACGGSDSPMINPMGSGAPSLAGLGCSRMLVLVAEKDKGRDCGVRYYDAVKESGYGGKVEVFEVEGEGHVFHIYDPDTDNAKLMFQRIASFLQK